MSPGPGLYLYRGFWLEISALSLALNEFRNWGLNFFWWTAAQSVWDLPLSPNRPISSNRCRFYACRYFLSHTFNRITCQGTSVAEGSLNVGHPDLWGVWFTPPKGLALRMQCQTRIILKHFRVMMPQHPSGPYIFKKSLGSAVAGATPDLLGCDLRPPKVLMLHVVAAKRLGRASRVQRQSPTDCVQHKHTESDGLCPT